MSMLAHDHRQMPVRDEADLDRTAIPYTDAATAALLDSAVDALVIVRGGRSSDPGARLSVLVSLSAELDERTRDVVWRARRDRLSWEIIAERLAMTASGARSRYGRHVRDREEADLLVFS
ncbi:MAG: hypothetical protein ACRDV4_11840 [Acidimicrobiales bacterium]